MSGGEANLEAFDTDNSLFRSVLAVDSSFFLLYAGSHHDGSHKRCISTFAPASSSLVHKVTSWMSGRRPEFIDPKMAARGDGREGETIHVKK